MRGHVFSVKLCAVLSKPIMLLLLACARDSGSFLRFGVLPTPKKNVMVVVCGLRLTKRT